MPFATHMLLVAALATGGDDPHRNNPVYAELLDQGVPIVEGFRIKLAPPSLADGLSPTDQKAAITKTAQGAFTFDKLMRKSVVAPHIYRPKEDKRGDVLARVVDGYFVAYGDLDTIAQKEFLEDLLASQDDDEDVAGTGGELTPEDLAMRGITIDPANKEREGYAHGSYALFRRVEVRGTIRSFWTRTNDSIVAGVVLDPRFMNDAKAPNEWVPLLKKSNGTVTPGTPQPYDGMGLYMKVTKLAEPADALFVEWHLVYVEPRTWFNGANLLGSKLNIIAQTQLREFRRKLLAASTGPKNQAQARKPK